MRNVYDAENLIDAHLVSDRLGAAGIAAFVSGGYLTGGIGELPVFGLVTVLVDDHDWPAARAIVESHQREIAGNGAFIDDEGNVFGDDPSLEPRPA